MILLYFFYKDRIIEKLLLGLASSTTIIVLLIVFFVFLEGAPAFQENDPADLIMGTTWNPFYSQGLSHNETITTNIEPYDFTLKAKKNHFSLPTDSTTENMILIENTGGEPNTIWLTITSELETDLENDTIYIEPNTVKSVNLSITTKNVETTSIIISGQSKIDGETDQIEITCYVHDYGFNVYPDTQTIQSMGDTLRALAPIKIENIGEKSDQIKIKIDHSDTFRPSIENVEWDYTNSSCIISLDPYETKNLTVIPRVVDLSPGTEYLNITAQSLNHPDIIDTVQIVYTHYVLDLFHVKNPHKNIAKNGSAEYTLFIEGNKGESFIVQINPIQGNPSIELTENNITLLNSFGEINYTLEKTGTSTITLSVSPNQPENIESYIVDATVLIPTTEPTLGFFVFIVGTIITTIVAVSIAAPLGLGVAMFLAEFTPGSLRKILRPLYELLAGIPSVIYGLFGWYTFGPVMKDTLYPLITDTIGKVIPFFSASNQMGQGVLTASIILSFMIIPIIITLSEDAIRSVHRELKEGSLALGATRWQTMRHTILPNAKSGIISSIILGTGRAIGETMAVLMIMGIIVRIPSNIFTGTATMTGIIASDFGWAYDDPTIRSSLFAIGIILFIMVFSLNLVIFFVSKDKNKSEKQMRKQLSQKMKSFFHRTKEESIDTTNSTTKNTSTKKFYVIDEVKQENKFIILNDFEVKQKDKKKETVKPAKRAIVTNRFSLREQIQSRKSPLLQQNITIGLLLLSALIVSIFLVWILGDIMIQGGVSLRPEYLFEVERMAGVEGGFLNAIIGSLYLVGIALAIAGPLSIGSAIYVHEYAKTSNIFTRIILFTSDTLASTPSIIFGAFGFMLFVLYLEFGFSLIAGGFTLAFMIIPLMLRSSIEAIKSVPNGIREGSYALGATKWQTISNVVIPPASAGIVSGVILAIGRAIGETAAVLLTVGYAYEIPTSVLHSAANLPNMIFNYYDLQGRHPELGEKVFASAFLLIIIVLILNAVARLVSRRSEKMMKN